jgi:exodeoxyribonuclease VIII
MKPGIYDIPFDEYRQKPGINKSLLDRFSLCPAEAKIYLDDPESGKATEAMIMGSAVDTLVCEPNLFDTRFWVRPDTYCNEDNETKPWSGNSKICKAWVKGHSDRPILTWNQHEEAHSIASTIKDHPIAGPLLAQCKAQRSMFWIDKSTGLLCKGRPDFVASRFGADLKVMRSIATPAVSKAIANYRLHLQAAFYTDGLNANGIACDDFYFICAKRVGDSKPLINIKRLALRAIDLARATYQRELAALRECHEKNFWPDYTGNEIGQIDLPEYAYQDFGGLGPLTIDGEEIDL